MDNPAEPSRLECRVGFANGGKLCDLWRGRGFRLQDAEITLSGDVLRVRSAGFLDDPVIDYAARAAHHRARMATPAEAASAKTGKPLARRLFAGAVAPDFAAPATRVRRKAVSWPADRHDLRELAPFDISIDPATARLPSLAMFPAGTHQPTASLDRDPGPADVAARVPAAARPALPTALDYFVGSAFRFDDVEILGFRIDLGRLGIETAGDPRTGAEAPDPRRGADRHVPREDDRAAELPSRPGARDPLPL